MSVKLESEIGTELHLEISDTDGRVRSSLIGIIPNELLILSITEKLAHQLKNRSSLPTITLRGISRGQAFGFQGQCLRVLATPHPMLLIEYPKAIQKQDIRKNRRVKCLLPAKFALDTTGIPGVIADLSNSGCHFQTNQSLNDNQRAIVQLNEQVLLSFELPGKETPKTVEAVIRNTFVDKQTIHVGFEFIDIDAATLKSIDEFVALSFDIQPF